MSYEMAVSQNSNVTHEVASVMEKIASVGEESDDKRHIGNIYTGKQKNALEEARSCIERLLTEYNTVQLDRDVTQQEAYAATEFYEVELQRTKDNINDLEMKLQKKEDEIISLQREWLEKMKASVIFAAKEKADILNQLHSCQAELSSLQSFHAHQIEVETELEQVKAELSQQQEKEQKRLTQLERKYIEKNEKFVEELQMHAEVTNALQRDKTSLQLENSKLVRDLDLLRQAEALHLQRSTRQARTIAENSIKLQRLQRNIGQMIKQYSAERRALEEEHERTVATLDTERQTLKRLAQMKIKELKKVRQLAQQVIKERTEVETFLIESLRYVTDQIKHSRRLPWKFNLNLSQIRPQSPVSSIEEGMLTPSSLPPIPSVRSVSSWPGALSSVRYKTRQDPSRQILHEGPKGRFQLPDERNFHILQQMQEVPVKSNPRVDISELTWEEREKVLRYLFQKINNAYQPRNAVPLQHEGYELLYGSASNADRNFV